MHHSSPIDHAQAQSADATPGPEGALRSTLLRGDVALAWSRDGRHRSTWAQVQAACPWSLPTLSVEFFETWAHHYVPAYEPLIFIARSADGKCVGLAPLAARNRIIVGAGAHQAEYQGWLSRCEDAVRVLRCLLDSLRAELPAYELHFKYLNDRMPLDEIVAALAADPQVTGRMHRTPLLRLDAATIQKSLDKKSNKSKLSRLKRGGDLRFDSVAGDHLTPAELERIAALYDFRQGAVNDSCPFADDARKLAFHRDWLSRHPEHVDLTLWRLNGAIIAALLGLRGAKAAHVAVLAYAPEHAHDSPGKFHVYQTALALARQGREWLDLTPGGDAWKERFATDHGRALEFRSYRSRFAALSARLGERATTGLRSVLVAMRLPPQKLRHAAARLRRASPVAIGRRLCRMLHEHVEMRIYRLELAGPEGVAAPATTNINDLGALARFTPIASWQSRQAFLAGALARIETGERAFTVSDAEGLVHCGWLIRSQSTAFLSEVGERYDYPAPGAVLYDFFTAARARGQGLYRRTIRQMLATVRAERESPVVYISTRADNHASRHVIETEGFQWIGSLHRRRRLGRESRWRQAGE